MLEISQLELTPLQLRDIEDSDPSLVSAWLEAASAPEIRSPTGYFLAGLRSGEPPWGPNREHAQNLRQAERWMTTVGIFYVTEEQALAELFDRGGLLQWHRDDPALVTRMTSLWRRSRPLGEQIEQQAVERAQRNAATYRALREVRTDGPGAGEGQDEGGAALRPGSDAAHAHSGDREGRDGKRA